MVYFVLVGGRNKTRHVCDFGQYKRRTNAFRHLLRDPEADK